MMNKRPSTQVKAMAIHPRRTPSLSLILGTIILTITLWACIALWIVALGGG